MVRVATKVIWNSNLGRAKLTWPFPLQTGLRVPWDRSQFAHLKSQAHVVRRFLATLPTGDFISCFFARRG